MKKLLLILLLAVLPLQYTWAAAAVYCTHEQAPTAKHFGHHTHHHEAAGAKADSPEKTPGTDNDCGTCHMAAQPSFISAITLLIQPAAGPHADHLPPRYTSHIAEGPQRPDWRALV